MPHSYCTHPRPTPAFLTTTKLTRTTNVIYTKANAPCAGSRSPRFTPSPDPGKYASGAACGNPRDQDVDVIEHVLSFSSSLIYPFSVITPTQSPPSPPVFCFQQNLSQFSGRPLERNDEDPPSLLPSDNQHLSQLPPVNTRVCEKWGTLSIHRLPKKKDSRIIHRARRHNT